MDSRTEAEVGFVQRRLPWVLLAGALAVYIFTLQRSATFSGLAVLAKTAGWDWHPNVVAPLHVLLTFPVRWLPGSAQLVCLNLTAALFAALTLGLLARSISLLPHDRTRLQRRVVHRSDALMDLRSAWLPPVVGVMVCGFQLSFWENAIAATGEALDLLLFAWLIHCLLEFRLDRKESRWRSFALVYGIAAANNFAMIGFFPAFLIAWVWLRGRSFFNLRFLSQMAACGIAGLSIYLLPPLLHYLNYPESFGVWEMLRGYLGYQKRSLVSFPRYIVLLCAVTSIFPILFISIRWPSRFGEISALGVKLTNFAVHLIHVALLIACTWVAFDPLFSPRNLVRGTSAMLPFYYLGALTIGYCVAYISIVSYAAVMRAEQRSFKFAWLAANSAILLIWTGAIAAAVGVFVKNLPLIQQNSSDALSQLARAAARSLPAEGSVLLSDDPLYLYSVQYELLKNNRAHKHVLIDTTSFTSPEYHRFLQKRYEGRWPGFVNPPPRKVPIEPASLVNVILQVRESLPVFYLHPSYGYYFEFFHAKPHQAVYELLPYPTNMLSGPLLTPKECEAQDAYWSSLRTSTLTPLLKITNPKTPAPVAKLGNSKPSTLERYVRDLYSRTFNDFGVALQRAGEHVLAARYFDLAVQMNGSNTPAKINGIYNARLQGGQRGEMQFDEKLLQHLKSFDGRWDLALRDHGAFDEPVACYRLAQALAAGNNFRQAGQQLERSIFFSPENRSARLDYMMMCVRMRLAEKAVNEISKYRSQFGPGIKSEEEMELVRIEAWAEVIQNNLPAAERILASAQTRYPTQTLPWDTLVEIYLQLGRETNALYLLKRQVEAQPGNVRALINYGGLQLRTGDFEGAFANLSAALRQKPDDEDGLFNHALASSASGRLEAAQSDFLALLTRGTGTTRHLQSLFGLAEVYFRRNKPAESLRYYREFLKAAGSGIRETEVARQRIKLLENKTPTSPVSGG